MNVRTTIDTLGVKAANSPRIVWAARWALLIAGAAAVTLVPWVGSFDRTLAAVLAVLGVFAAFGAGYINRYYTERAADDEDYFDGPPELKAAIELIYQRRAERSWFAGLWSSQR